MRPVPAEVWVEVRAGRGFPIAEAGPYSSAPTAVCHAHLTRDPAEAGRWRAEFAAGRIPVPPEPEHPTEPDAGRSAGGVDGHDS